MKRHPTFRYLVVVEGGVFTDKGWLPEDHADLLGPIRWWSTYQKVSTFKKALKVLVGLMDAGLPARLEVDKKMWARKSSKCKQWCGYKTLTLKAEVEAQ